MGAQFLFGKTIFVVDKKGKLLGYYNAEHTQLRYDEKIKHSNIKDICRRDVKYVRIHDDLYKEASLIFAEHSTISILPIVNDEMVVVDLLYRFQCFYREYYYSHINKCPKKDFFPYAHYAHCIYETAKLAKHCGYKNVSILEFGVAGGNGLLSCELHAKEISRLFDVAFTIYGFDLGKGLPHSEDPRDIVELFAVGDYPMDIERLQKKLRHATLVLGDIRETVPAFLSREDPSPIGCMFVDVDYYSSTVPILNLLEREHDFFLPIVHMYFDDIFEDKQFQGQALAIKEFNERNTSIKISPEFLNWTHDNWQFRRIKQCARFGHPKYPQKKPSLTQPANETALLY